jgi:hypothetical protein
MPSGAASARAPQARGHALPVIQGAIGSDRWCRYTWQTSSCGGAPPKAPLYPSRSMAPAASACRCLPTNPSRAQVCMAHAKQAAPGRACRQICLAERVYGCTPPWPPLRTAASHEYTSTCATRFARFAPRHAPRVLSGSAILSTMHACLEASNAFAGGLTTTCLTQCLTMGHMRAVIHRASRRISAQTTVNSLTRLKGRVCDATGPAVRSMRTVDRSAKDRSR